MSVHYRPSDGFVGDPIPFYWDGEYHLFYLKAPTSAIDVLSRLRTPWEHLVSKDLVHWAEQPRALDCGPPLSPDQDGVWTGSVIEREGTFHIFYTGFNSENRRGTQTICHATSTDLIRWEKNFHNPILSPDTQWYETGDWRDPFVFWNSEEQCYWMLIAARIKTGPLLRRGCIALASSSDLVNWKIHPPLWAPYLTYTMECPDLFQWGERWYLLFSRFSEKAQTCYRVAKDIRGPWKSRTPEGLDGLRFYAAKTLWDGKNRYAFGSVPTRKDEHNEGIWEWGGDLAIPRQLTMLSDGTLGVQCPQAVLQSYHKEVPFTFEHKLGHWENKNKKIFGNGTSSFGYGFIPVPSREFLFQISITLSCANASAGILLKSRADLSRGYMIALEPSRNRVVFCRWPQSMDKNYELVFPPNFKIPSPEIYEPPLVDRPLSITRSCPVRFQVLVSDTIIEVFINDQIALTYRVYEHSDAPLGLFVEEGSAQFEKISLRIP